MRAVAFAIWLEARFSLWIDEASKITTYTRAGWNRRAWLVNCCGYDPERNRFITKI